MLQLNKQKLDFNGKEGWLARKGLEGTAPHYPNFRPIMSLGDSSQLVKFQSKKASLADMDL